jgi:hypothetical protein
MPLQHTLCAAQQFKAVLDSWRYLTQMSLLSEHSR